MANFCINCGTKVKKGDKFCSNCGTKIINDDNFCIHCGGEIRDGDKFCIHCGTKIDKFHIKSNNSLEDSIENNGITQKEELVKRKFEVIDELYESEEIQTLIRENNLFEYEIGNIKFKLRKYVKINNKISDDKLKNNLIKELNKVIEDKRKQELMEIKKLEENTQNDEKTKFKVIEDNRQRKEPMEINKKLEQNTQKREEKRKFKLINQLYESVEIQTLIRENNLFEYEIGYIKIKLRKLVRANNKISADELKDYLKNELNKVIEDKRKRKEKLMGTNTASGGYCGLDCVHYCTEYLSYDEGVVGDFGVGDYCEYYCSLGHSIYEGSYCKDFEFEGQWLFSR